MAHMTTVKIFLFCVLIQIVAAVDNSYASGFLVLNATSEQGGSWATTESASISNGAVYWGYYIDASAVEYFLGSNVTLTKTNENNETSLLFSATIDASSSTWETYFSPCSSNIGNWTFTLDMAVNGAPVPQDGTITVYYSNVGSTLRSSDSVPEISSQFEFIVPIDGTNNELAFNFTGPADKAIGQLLETASLFSECVVDPLTNTQTPIATANVATNATLVTLKAAVDSGKNYYLLLTSRSSIPGDVDQSIISIAQLQSESESLGTSNESGGTPWGIIVVVLVVIALIIGVIIAAIGFVIYKKKKASGEYDFSDDY